ncbi:MAG TPA: NERD domain-containing protein [candidate division Zixibacteria bacterium]|nr:NERD domain-containing protein [candidate division Zixibacteria bacterium]
MEFETMQILCEVIISILKVSKGEPVLHELVKKEVKLPLETTERLLQTLLSDGLVYLLDGFLQTNSLQRVSLALRALELGADYERVSGFLEWKEFESLAAVALEMHGYAVTRNVRFRQGGRRWEIDIVGCRRPLVVCVDCKHWRHGLHPSKLRGAVDEQVKRTMAFSEALPNPTVRVEFASWDEARFVPAVVSLVPASFKFHERTPVVPILQLRDFLAQLPMCLDSLRSFERAQRHLKIA